MSQTTNPTCGKGFGRKPVDLIAASNYSTHEITWAAIRQLKTFSSDDLICHIAKRNKVNDSTVKHYVNRLLKGRYLSHKDIEKPGVATLFVYTLARDVGINAPRLKADGTPSTQGKGRQNLWRTMRVLSEFDYKELAIAASLETLQISQGAAKDYVFHLNKAGYLKQTKACNKGKPPALARYRLIPSKYTGPKAPMVQRIKQVFDPNINKVMYHEAGGVK